MTEMRNAMERTQVSSPNEFVEWFCTETAGSECVYFIGCLIFERLQKKIDNILKQEALQAATLALRYSGYNDKGKQYYNTKVFLYQKLEHREKNSGHGTFLYIARKI